LTVIAVGTSQLELVVSMTRAPKGQPELAMRNIVGSNIFNILAVLSTPCVIAPTEVGSDLLWRDYAVIDPGISCFCLPVQGPNEHQ